MSEQKYDVFQVVDMIGTSRFQGVFTKSELAKIMDGALYTQTLYKDCIPPDHVYYGNGEEIVSEWINPLIELMPVEDNE